MWQGCVAGRSEHVELESVLLLLAIDCERTATNYCLLQRILWVHLFVNEQLVTSGCTMSRSTSGGTVRAPPEGTSETRSRPSRWMSPHRKASRTPYRTRAGRKIQYHALAVESHDGAMQVEGTGKPKHPSLIGCRTGWVELYVGGCIVVLGKMVWVVAWRAHRK